MEDNRRKTCRVDLTDTIVSTNGVLFHYWECSECGQTHEEVEGEYDYCPHCGAQIVEWHRPNERSAETRSHAPYFPPL